MGTTLQNGVYLPNEGERNCYAGLKTNWEILDQKVADVTALQQAVAGALHREIVESLPTTDIDPNTIYMILSGTSATENVYNEFMYVNNAWELIGTSATDLTNYYTKGDVDGLLLLKANASDLTSHTGDTTIHVTASDKTKWTNSANTVVLRLAKTALTPSSSTNAFSNLDDATALKIGDKVMDTAGVLFEVTAIDTANSTFTIGTALIDLANDSDVVHKSGNETVNGTKDFTGSLRVYNSDSSANTAQLWLKNSKVNRGQFVYGDQPMWFRDATDKPVTAIISRVSSFGASMLMLYAYNVDQNNQQVSNNLSFIKNLDGTCFLLPDQNDVVELGSTGARWKSVCATNYYYGSNNVEFSTKFVTTDTVQDVTANKNFKGLIETTGTLWPINTQTTDDITFLGNCAVHVEQRGSRNLTDLSGGAWNIANLGTGCFFFRQNNGTDIRYKHFPTNVVSKICVMSNDNKFISDLVPDTTNAYNLGNSSFKWSTLNGVEPSALGMPDTDNGIDISSYITVNGGNKESFYTPTANGWISVALTRAGGANMAVMLRQGNFASSGHNIAQENGTTSCNAMLPVKGGVQVSINSALADGIAFAYFYPCLGNV